MMRNGHTGAVMALFALVVVALVVVWLRSQDPNSMPAGGSVAKLPPNPYPAAPSPAASATPGDATAESKAVSPELRQVSTARYVTLDSWSPDGRWLAEWVDLSTPQPGVPAPGYSTLRFVAGSGAQICDHIEVRHSVETDAIQPVVWLVDGQVHIDGFGGQPCAGPFKALPGLAAEPTPGMLGGPVSPDGGYRVVTALQPKRPDDSTEHLVTTLVRQSDDRAVARVPWRRSVFYRDPIGQWLPDGSFLIRQTYDRGPLRVMVDGTVSQVAPDVFGVAGTGSNETDEQIAYAVLGEDPPYHLALWSRDQGLQLHHPETGQLESLGQDQRSLGTGALETFKIQNPWWETPWPTGWMVVAGASSGTLARRPDPPGGPWIGLPGNPQDSQWSPGGDYLATGSGFASSAELELVTFPDLSPVLRHSLPWLDRMIWSPDGRRLAISTNSGDSGATYLLKVVPR